MREQKMRLLYFQNGLFTIFTRFTMSLLVGHDIIEEETNEEKCAPYLFWHQPLASIAF